MALLACNGSQWVRGEVACHFVPFFASFANERQSSPVGPSKRSHYYKRMLAFWDNLDLGPLRDSIPSYPIRASAKVRLPVPALPSLHQADRASTALVNIQDLPSRNMLVKCGSLSSPPKLEAARPRWNWKQQNRSQFLFHVAYPGPCSCSAIDVTRPRIHSPLSIFTQIP